MAAKKQGRNTNSDDSGLSSIEAKLEILVGLIAITVAPDTLSLKERAVRLNRVGMTPKDIAALYGVTPNNVSVALTGAKRQSKSTKMSTKKKGE